MEPGFPKNICEKNIKKYLKRKGKCKPGLKAITFPQKLSDVNS